MAKISINYYQNDKLKSNKNGKKLVYIRVIHKRVLSRIKSGAANKYMTTEEFKTFCASNNAASEIKKISSFFESIENVISDFQISKSKVNFGEMLRFYTIASSDGITTEEEIIEQLKKGYYIGLGNKRSKHLTCKAMSKKELETSIDTAIAVYIQDNPETSIFEVYLTKKSDLENKIVEINVNILTK